MQRAGTSSATRNLVRAAGRVFEFFDDTTIPDLGEEWRALSGVTREAGKRLLRNARGMAGRREGLRTARRGMRTQATVLELE
ncbi:hypothetical protein LTR16_005790, partial [Cryomyces antarcticus]